MATLNIKDFPDRLYRTVRHRARTNRRSISQEVIHILEEVTHGSRPASLLELKGLGKNLWRRELEKKDAPDYIAEEGRSWS